VSKYRYRNECGGVSFDTGRERLVVSRSTNTWPTRGWQAEHVVGWRVAWRLVHGEGPRLTAGGMWAVYGRRYRSKRLALASMERRFAGRVQP
jgi:hypothetical protein